MKHGQEKDSCPQYAKLKLFSRKAIYSHNLIRIYARACTYTRMGLRVYMSFRLRLLVLWLCGELAWLFGCMADIVVTKVDKLSSFATK